MTGVEDRATGALLGLACGDALGRPVAGWAGAEIASRHRRLTEMRADGSGGRPAGTTTGVTARTLRVARSVVDGSGDPDAYDAPGDAPPLLRGVPLAVAHRDAPDRLSARVAATADADRTATAASVALARVVAELVGGAEPSDALDAALADAGRRNAPPAVRTALATATDGATASPGGGAGAVEVFETALHDGSTAPTAEEAVVAAVNRGGATTATGAAAGAVGGARFGAAALPDRWLDHLDGEGRIHDLAGALVAGPID